MFLLTLIFAGFALALVHPHLHRLTPNWSAAWVALYPAGVFLASLSVLLSPETSPITFSYPWMDALGMHLSLQLDQFSLLFVLLISGIGALIFLYANAYFKGSAAGGRIVTILLIFLSSMLGLVCSSNLLVMFVFWELTSVCSFLLVGYKHESLKARKAALQALLVTGGGGLALLGGIILLGQMVGSYELSELIRSHELIIGHSHYSLAVVLILLGAFTKSAQIPFHFWLPGAMEAPTPVSAYLHSATMVKAGVFLVARMNPVLGNTELWTTSLISFGAVTMVLGAFLALIFSDLKHILAYSTVSALGTLMMLIGVDSSLGLRAALAFIVVHALYKAALFMVAGTIDIFTGTREITRLSGLARQFPVLATAATLAGLSMAGVPPFFGFVGKELIYKTFTSGSDGLLLLIAGFVANAVTIAVVGLAVVVPFFRGLRTAPLHEQKTTGKVLVVAPLILAVGGLFAGLYASQVGTVLIEPAAQALGSRQAATEIKLWYGFNFVLLLSALTLIAGAAVFFQRRHASDFWNSLHARGWTRYASHRIYEVCVESTVRMAQAVTVALQHGSQRRYMWVLLLTIVAALSLPLILLPISIPAPTPFSLPLFAAILIVIIGAAFAIQMRSSLSAVLSLGAVGYGIALIYALFGAPDLAITQLLVETLTLILVAYALVRLPPMYEEDSRRPYLWDGAIAAMFGAVITIGLLAITAEPTNSPVSAFHRALSLIEGQGRNVVNVILVDFRALDTLGEITVLVIAALGVAALVERGVFRRGGNP